MADYKVTDTELISVANAIRTRGGTSAQLEWPSEFVSAVNAIPTGGGGGNDDIDYTYLPNSVSANVIASSDASMFSSQYKIGSLPVIRNTTQSEDLLSVDDGYVVLTQNIRIAVPIGIINTSATCYFAGKNGGQSSEISFLGIPYNNNSGNSPFFCKPNNNTKLQYAIIGSNTDIPNVSSGDLHVMAIAYDGQQKNARYFIDGEYIGEKTLTGNAGCFVIFNGWELSGNVRNATVKLKYGGVVLGAESNNAVIANMQTIMSKIGMTS